MSIFKIFNITQFFIAYRNISIKQILYNILIFMFYKTLTMLEKVSIITRDIFREKSSPLMCDLIGVSSRFRTFYSHCEGKSRKIAEAMHCHSPESKVTSLIIIHRDAKLNLSLTNLPIRWCSLIVIFLEYSKILSSM